MITIERRSPVPIAVRCIDNPIGTMTGGPPTRLSCMRPSEVSRHVSPPTAYQASGPEWICVGAVIPGVKSASINCAEYFSPVTTGSGPISAMRFPWVDLQFWSSIVISHTLPNDSTTVPRGPLSASAARRVGYASRCQNTRGLVIRPMGLCRPGSSIRSVAFVHSPAYMDRREQQHLVRSAVCMGTITGRGRVCR